MHHLRTFPSGPAILAAALGASLLAACSGGGASAPGSLVPGAKPTQAAVVPPSSSSAQVLSVGFAGVSTLGRTRAPSSLAGTPVTVTANGATVATGTLDANGTATLTFTTAVPRGTTVQITAGRITATAVLSVDTAATTVAVTVHGDGTITVASSNGQGGEDATETETEKGEVEDVQSGSQTMLPANLPFAVTTNCSTITVTAKDARIAFIDFLEKGSDNDSESQARLKIINLPFGLNANNPLTEPVTGASARIEIRVYDASHSELVKIKAPINAFTSGTPATPCPVTSGSPSPGSSPGASPTPKASHSPDPRASGTPEPKDSASPGPSPSATASSGHS